MDITGDFQQVEQNCPDWAKEILAVIVQMPTVQATYSVEALNSLLEKECQMEKEHGVMKDIYGNPRFGGRELRKLQLKAGKKISLSQKNNNIALHRKNLLSFSK